MRQLCDAAIAGDRAAAEAIDARLQPLHNKLFCESNPIPVKWALQRMGLIGPGIRLPLTPLAPQYHAVVLEAMAAASVQVAAA
jgi:4-hydroxy-tetrahydrodipicolinate synthase